MHTHIVPGTASSAWSSVISSYLLGSTMFNYDFQLLRLGLRISKRHVRITSSQTSHRIIGPCALEGSCAWEEMGSLQWAMYILFGTDAVILKRQMVYVVCFKLPAKIPSHKWHLRTFCFVRPFKVRVYGSCKNS